MILGDTLGSSSYPKKYFFLQGSEKTPSTLSQEPLKYGLLSVENNKESSITSWKTHDLNSIIILKDPTSVAMESEVISPKPLLNEQTTESTTSKKELTIYIQKKTKTPVYGKVLATKCLKKKLLYRGDQTIRSKSTQFCPKREDDEEESL